MTERSSSRRGRKSKAQRGPGRPPTPDDLKRRNVIRHGLTDDQYVALKEWMAAQNIADEAAALYKIVLDRLKADGHYDPAKP